jgi:hypothetical protein
MTETVIQKIIMTPRDHLTSSLKHAIVQSAICFKCVWRRYRISHGVANVRTSPAYSLEAARYDDKIIAGSDLENFFLREDKFCLNVQKREKDN